MSTYQYYRIAQEGGIAICCINRPEVRNAMNSDCWKELRRFLQEAGTDPSVRAIILTGTGDKAFVSGSDINKLMERTAAITVNSTDSRPTLRSIEECPKPVIAALNGAAFGGGFELALACDIRIAAEGIKMGMPEAELGLIPGAGGTQRLTRLVGESIAKQVILAGRVLTAEEAKLYGILYAAVPGEELLAKALSVAKKMARKGPLALQIAKRLIHHAGDMDLTTGIMMENLGFAVTMGSQDKEEGVHAFLEKRASEFKGE